MRASRTSEGAIDDSERCRADWRRDDGYWRCTRDAGHRGRHRLRSAIPSDSPARSLGSLQLVEDAAAAEDGLAG